MCEEFMFIEGEMGIVLMIVNVSVFKINYNKKNL